LIDAADITQSVCYAETLSNIFFTVMIWQCEHAAQNKPSWEPCLLLLMIHGGDLAGVTNVMNKTPGDVFPDARTCMHCLHVTYNVATGSGLCSRVQFSVAGQLINSLD